MRRAAVAMLTAIVLAAGCSEVVSRRESILSLTTLCANVNRQIAGIEPIDDPELFASQMQGLVDAARRLPGPEDGRALYRRVLASFQETADRFAEARDAAAQGDQNEKAAQVDAALEQLGETDELAQDYGMVPLDQCDEELAAASRTPSAAPPRSEQPETEVPTEEGSIAATGWRRLEDAPIARQHVAAARVGGLIYVAGGIEGQTATTTVQAFDPSVGNWRDQPDLPIALHGAMAVEYDGEFVVLGGWQPDGDDLTATVSDRVLALRDREWVDLQRLNRPRAAGAAAVIDNRIVVVGGQADNELIAETEIYHGDDERWRDRKEILTPRQNLAAAADGSYVYAVGGRDLTVDRNLDVLERYDPVNDEWGELEPMRTPRSGVGADILGGRLVVVGGESPTAVHGDTEAYHITSDTWSAMAPLSVPRHDLAVVRAGATLYAIDGAEGGSRTGSSSAVESLRLPALPTTWREGPNAELARQQVAVAAVGGDIWVAGGLEDLDIATTAVQRLETSTGTWHSEEPLPVALDHAMAVSYEGKPVVIGGYAARNDAATATASDQVYQLRSGTWEELPPLQHARAAGAAVVVGDQIIVVGGRGNEGLVPQTEIYDGETWRDAEPISTPREHLTAAAHGGRVYAVGGREASPDTNVAVLERYDPEADQWEALQDMTTARGSIGGAVVEGRFVVVGGEASDDVYDVVEMYDFASDTWAPAAALLIPVHGPGVAAVGAELYVIGGAQSVGHTNSSADTQILPFE